MLSPALLCTPCLAALLFPHPEWGPNSHLVNAAPQKTPAHALICHFGRHLKFPAPEPASPSLSSKETVAFNSTPAGAQEQTEPFLEGKDLTIHHGARFHFCGCCLQRRHCKARRGEPTARSRFAHPDTWASPAAPATHRDPARMSPHRWQQVFGQQVSGGSLGCPASPSVTPRPRGAQGVVRALCPEGREGLPGRRSLPEQ